MFPRAMYTKTVTTFLEHDTLVETLVGPVCHLVHGLSRGNQAIGWTIGHVPEHFPTRRNTSEFSSLSALQ